MNNNSVFGNGFMGGFGMPTFNPVSFMPSFTSLFNPASFMQSFQSFDFSNMFSNFNFNNSFANFGGFDFSNAMFGNMFNFNSGFCGVNNITRQSGPLQSQLAQKALSYVGNVNSDSEGNRLFSKGQNRPWCSDFVSTLVHNVYGNKLPSTFPPEQCGVASIRSWAESNNRFIKLPSSNQAEFIAKNVKVGDLMIITRPAGKHGHSAIVTKVNSDGSFETVGGNESNSVKKKNRTYTTEYLAGFVSMDGIA